MTTDTAYKPRSFKHPKPGIGPYQAAQKYKHLFPKLAHSTLFSAVKEGLVKCLSQPGETLRLDEASVLEYLQTKYKTRAGPWNAEEKVQEITRLQREHQVAQALLQERPPEGVPINVSRFARKYNISQQLISIWVKARHILVLQRPTEPGQPLMIDEASGYDYMKAHYKSKPRKHDVQAQMTLGRKQPGHMTSAHPRPSPHPTSSPNRHGQQPVTPAEERSAQVAEDLFSDTLNSTRLLKDYLEWQKKEGRSKATTQETIDRLTPFVQRFSTLPIDHKTIQAYIDKLAGAPQSRWDKAVRIQAFYNWLWKRGRLDDYCYFCPFDRIDLPSKKTERPDPLTQDQVSQLINKAPSLIHFVLLMAFCYAGFRRGELQSLRTEAITPPTDGLPGLVTVKGKTGSRMVNLDPRVYNALMIIAPPKGYIFHQKNAPETPVSVSSITHWIRDAIIASGIVSKKNGPQLLRHTFSALQKQLEGANTELYAKFTGHSLQMATQVYGKLPTDFERRKFLELSQQQAIPEPPWYFGKQSALSLPIEDSSQPGDGAESPAKPPSKGKKGV